MKKQDVTIRDILQSSTTGPFADEQVNAAVNRIRVLLEASADAVWELDVPGNSIWYSDGWYAMLGYPKDRPPWDDSANPFLELIHPDDRETVLEAMADHVCDKTEVYRAKFRLQHASGMWRWMLSRGKAVERDSHGTASRVVGTHMDISEWQALAAENVMAERRHAALLRSVPDMIFLTTRQGVILDYHATKRDLLAAAPEEFLGKSIRDVLPHDLAETSIRLFSQALDKGTTLTHEYALPIGGDMHFFEARITPYDQECVSNIVRDVTREVQAGEQLRQAEERLRQAERLHTIGQLASGIAHDFNNQMNNVLFLGDMLSKRAAEPEKVRRYAEMMVRRAQASSELTGKLLTFARSKTSEQETIDLHDVLEEVLALLEYTVGKAVRLHADLQAKATSIVADRSQLENAMLNLAINAEDAMQQGGDLSIATRNVTLDGGLCHTLGTPYQPGRYVTVTIKDTGSGIDPELLPTIFEPFVTTKGPTQGCGLGLATVADTVRTLNGMIEVESTPGLGSTFNVHIPTHDGEPTRERAEPRTTGRGGGRILVADDERLFRLVVGELLEDLGYQVVLCSNADDAEASFATQADSFDAVIIDVAMPGRNGIQLFRRLRALKPDIPVLIISGTAIERYPADLSDLQPYQFLGKPMKPDTLAATLAQMTGKDRPE